MRLRRPSVFLVFLMLLLAPGSATAQTAAQEGKWSGRLELVTGLGFHTVLDEDTVKDTLFHLREQVFVQLARTTPTFSFSTQAQGVFVKNETQTLRTTFRGKQEMEMFGRGNNFYQPGSSIRSDFNWRPSPKNQYTAFLTYQYGYDHTDNLTARLSADTLNAFHLKAAQEEKRVHRHTATAGWRATHQLVSPHMMLLTAGDWRASFVDQTSTWTKGDFTFVEDNTNSYSLYRLMPQTGSNEGTVSVSLRDTLLRSEHSLTIEPGLRFRLSETRDENSGSTYVDETHWRDSTRLHEDFDFVTLQLDPQFRLEYRYKSLRLSADYSLQFYSRQLTSQLHYQRLEWQPLLVVGRSFADWAPAPGHQLTLGNTLSVTRPSYLQTCWYDRQGEDPSQLFRGNPGLRPARSISTDLTWRFRRGNFNLTANTVYDYRKAEFERIFYDREIDGNTYKVFTWLNTYYGHLFTQRMQLGWNGRFLSSSLQVNYQQRQQRHPETKARKNSNNWELFAEITGRPGNGWTLSLNGSYKGDIETLYSLIEKHYIANALIRKDFKRFSLYLEGRDLLDRPITTHFYSQDNTEEWEETVYRNQRIFLLGFSWRF